MNRRQAIEEEKHSYPFGPDDDEDWLNTLQGIIMPGRLKYSLPSLFLPFSHKIITHLQVL